MVATRRSGATSDTRDASPSKTSRTSVPSTVSPIARMSHEATTSYADMYRAQRKVERDEENKNIFRRCKGRVGLLCFQSNIILGPMMLDGWEKFLFYSSFLGITVLLILTILRSPPITWAVQTLGDLLHTNIWQRLQSMMQ